MNSQILQDIRDFVREEITLAEAPLLIGDFVTAENAVEQLRSQIKSNGWWAPHLPEELGGMGLNLHDFAQISEILAWSPLGHVCFNAQAPDVGNMEILHRFGTPEQQERWLHPLANGDIRSCFSMTEPEHAGSNPVKMSTTAVRDGADYVINGHKWFSTAADGAAFAIVMAITDPHAESRYNTASQIIVPTDTTGYIHERRIPIMGDEGLGFFSHSEIRYEDCRVPVSNVLGEEGAGFAIAQERLGPGRIHHCMRWIGISERAFHMMCERAATRELSSGNPLATRQTIQNWIAESRATINAARLMVMDAARQIDELGQREARVAISTIKFYVANVLMTVLDRAIQVHGALGITDDTVLSYWYRHERGARIYDGPDEVHKFVVAREELKKYGVSLRMSQG